MLEGDSLLEAINEKVVIVSYDPSWPLKFDEERRRLEAVCPAAFVAIEHVGSTAVPMLRAKPVIDVMGGVRSLAEADGLLEVLCENGYVTSAEFNATLVDERWLMRHAEGHRAHHLHLLVFGGSEWNRRIAFRDALRTDRELCSRYEGIKLGLAEEFGSDREAYTAAKSDFVAEILRGVRQD